MSNQFANRTPQRSQGWPTVQTAWTVVWYRTGLSAHWWKTCCSSDMCSRVLVRGLNGLLPKFTWIPVLIGSTATGFTTCERGRLSLREQASESRPRIKVPMDKGRKCMAPGAEPWWSTPNTTGWAEESAVGTKTGTGENCMPGSLTKATLGFGKSNFWGYRGAAGRVCCLALELQESSKEATSFISEVSSSGASGRGIGCLLSDSTVFLDSFWLCRQLSIFLFLLGGSLKTTTEWKREKWF